MQHILLTMGCSYAMLVQIAAVCIACEEIKPDDELCLDGMCRACWSSVSSSKRIPRYQRKIDLKKHFGLDYRDYVSMYVGQAGSCWICGTKLEKFKTDSDTQTACVDHDHETGEVRGLLCVKCNLGLGYFNDSPELLDRAIEYLLK